MIYLLYVFFGVLPSFIWLLFFLRKDAHPEPKRMVLNIFLYGMLITLPALMIELGFDNLLPKTSLPPLLIILIYWIIGVAFIEEFLKYLVIRGKVLRSPEFDEPLDIILYMIIVGLGFAALENILHLISLGQSFLIKETLLVVFGRFISATLLHALSSGLVGYFLIWSFLEPRKRGRFLCLGLGIATLLHGLYNFSMIRIEESIIIENGILTVSNPQVFLPYFLTLIAILVGPALFITLSFKRVKKIASICKIKLADK